MTTYQHAYRSPDWAVQSRVVHSGEKMNGCNRWSVQLMRTRSRYGAREKRGWQLFVAAYGYRVQVGTR